MERRKKRKDKREGEYYDLTQRHLTPQTIIRDRNEIKKAIAIPTQIVFFTGSFRKVMGKKKKKRKERTKGGESNPYEENKTRAKLGKCTYISFNK